MLIRSLLRSRLATAASLVCCLLFIIGCPPNEPPPGQGDADNDGVIDANDDCPNTPAGADVDNNGCPITVEEDADDDGVADDDDDCPNTPAGADVDANGCAASQLDDDEDGVSNADDLCPDTAAGVEVEANGCPADDPTSGDDDEDGVSNNVDQCPDTPADTAVEPNGCPDSDDDGVADNIDECPNTARGAEVNEVGCPAGGGGGGGAVCGDGDREGDEECDDGNTVSGDGCSAACRTETPGMGNDFCSDPDEVEDGTVAFDNIGAQTDGPDGGPTCNFFGRTEIESDVWYCYTATCTGAAIASLCGSEYDTKMAVYAGCGCPSQTAAPLDCSDDDCGTGVENVQSRVTWQATQGQQYMIRIGGFLSEQGEGRLTISCGEPNVCGTSTNACDTESAEGTPGCSDATCCNSVCEVDRFCCDLEWDDFCADEAEGLCDGSFAACAAGSGACGSANGTPGCSNVDCCNNVCERDPYCCITEWDDNCASEANAFCALTCGARAGDCFTVHAGAGCNIIACCQEVCPDDPFCCETEWDASCVSKAMQLCDEP